METVYKVVDLWEGEYRSFAAWMLGSEYWVTYKLGEVAYPTIRGSRLFAFDTQVNAEKYILDRRGKCLLECECGNFERYSGQIPSALVAERCWENGILSGNGVQPAPEGTVLVGWLVPRKVIW